MENFAGRLASLLSSLVFRGASEVHRRPGFAVALYVAALCGVLASTSGKGAGRRMSESPQNRLLRSLEEAGLRTVQRRYRVGDEIYAAGAPADSLYFLLSGVVRTCKNYGDLKEATTALLKDEGVFGALDLDGEGESQQETAEALTEARVVAVRKSALAWLVKRNPEASLALLSAFSERGRQAEELHGILLRREVASRLAGLLSTLGERFGRREAEDEFGPVTIDIGLTHRQLADMIASTREAVSKAMVELRCEELIEVRGDRKIVLLDPAALSRYAEDGSLRRKSQPARG